MSNDWRGRKVAEARAYIGARLPSPCGQCTATVNPGDDFVVGHVIPRWEAPHLTWEPSNWCAEHKRCSHASAQGEVIRKAKAEALASVGVFPTEMHPEQPPPLPFSLPAAQDGLTEVRADLVWPNATRDAPAWLRPYLDVPGDVASAPLAMSPPHPQAVDSYGPALIEWAQEAQGVTVRWWQALSIVRALEHRADGSLCWPEIVLSASRRSGKSVIVRLLALWRLMFAPALFGEPQLIVHSASTLRVAKEPMRYASRWARMQPDLTVSTNNNNYAIESDDGHRWIVLPPDKTAGLDTCLAVLDEAWATKPEVVDDDLEPSLLERVSPQLLLVSTSHRRATSLMRGRLSGALAVDDGRTLLLLWAPAPGADPMDPVTWRAASPHWTAQRAEMIAAKLAKAMAGEQDVEFDDPDPVEGWRSQFLNVWRLRERTATRGESLVTPEAWATLATPLPDTVPSAAAIEEQGGLSLALAWRVEGRAVVSVTDHDILADAVTAWRESGHRGPLLVGASLLADPALKGVRTGKATGRTGAAVADLRRLLAEDALRHDGGPHLADQVTALRTTPGADGPRMSSTGRADAVKSAVWAAQAARSRSTGGTRVLLPST